MFNSHDGERNHFKLNFEMGFSYLSRQLTRERLDLPSSNSTHPSCLEEEPYWYLVHWVKGQGHQGQIQIV